MVRIPVVRYNIFGGEKCCTLYSPLQLTNYATMKKLATKTINVERIKNGRINNLVVKNKLLFLFLPVAEF